MGFKSQIKMIGAGFSHILHGASTIKNGQATNYAILQTSHRLEKGMCIRNPRSGWGFDKALSLAELIHTEEQKRNSDNEAVNIGKAVLAAYIEHKEAQNDSPERLASLKEKIESYSLSPIKDNAFGGTQHILRNDLILDTGAVEKLFYSRHSVRDFDDSEVEQNKIIKAVEYALRAPSACNRQATHVYIMSESERMKAGGGNEYHANKYLILTGVMDAYAPSELEDWIVSTSIFAGYLSLALHSQGIGACVIRKSLIYDGDFGKGIRRVCAIPDNEAIVLELAIGNYKDEFDVPVSYRRSAKDLIKHS